MIVDVSTSIVIHRPRPDVAGYAARPDNAPSWCAAVTGVRWLTEPPLGVGSAIRFTTRWLGRRFDYVYEVVDYALAERLVMRTADGSFPMETTYLWHDTPEGWTHMTVRSRCAPAGVAKLALPLIGIATRVADRNDLVRLRRILEQGIRVERHEGGSEPLAAA
ncbi:MAG TPA: SRPBCC family protein [Thermoleophilia bacterium]|nr:SRPBCC family protein [Thermoleophilia bacterium]